MMLNPDFVYDRENSFCSTRLPFHFFFKADKVKKLLTNSPTANNPIHAKMLSGLTRGTMQVVNESMIVVMKNKKLMCDSEGTSRRIWSG